MTHNKNETSEVQVDIQRRDTAQLRSLFSPGLLEVASRLPKWQQVLIEASVVSRSHREEIGSLPEWDVKHIVVNDRLNNARFINKFLEAANEKMPEGGFLLGSAETAAQRHKRILAKYPRLLGYPMTFVDFIYKRVLPKLRISRNLYFRLTGGRNRVMAHAEILGRLSACGFKIVEQREVQNQLYFAVQKVKAPAYDNNPSYGPVFKMRRVGKGGRITHFYKMRTMHPYAEYLQEYLYETNQLDEGGKIKNDFRVTSWGKVMRRLWIDELPMIANLLKGDMKIVGVRPLSEHYLSLYPAEAREKRLQHKPGLLPPFYADLPRTLDEIVESEMRYLRAYEANPIPTDIRYLFAALYNILYKRARSK